jgi:hypothetical protein
VHHKNRTATNKTIKGLAAGGRLEQVDQGLVGLATTTAELLDQAIEDPEEPTYAVAAMGRLHLAVLSALTGKENADADAGLTQVIAALSTPLGHPTE